MEHPVTVAVHGEPQLIRYGLDELFGDDPVVRLVEGRFADAVLVDPFPTGMLSPSLALRRIAQAGTEGRAVIAYTWRVNRLTSSLALRRGCRAIVDKNWDIAPLTSTIVQAVRGGVQIEPPDLGLTPRQIEAVQHVAAGRTNGEIAATQNVSAETVKADLRAAMRIHDLRNRAHLASWAISHGLETAR